jgi:hypothetical protein
VRARHPRQLRGGPVTTSDTEPRAGPARPIDTVISGGPAGEAALGECDDQGNDPGGISFPDDAGTVGMVRLPGADTTQAVGVRTPDGIQVFVADGLAGSSRSEVVAALGLEE